VNSIVGFNPPRRGKVVFKGDDITRKASFETVRSGMGLVPQGRRAYFRHWAWKKTFCRERSPGNTRRPCGTSPMPLRTVSNEALRVMSSPLNTTLPRRGGLNPTIEFTSVDLPTPLRRAGREFWPAQAAATACKT